MPRTLITAFLLTAALIPLACGGGSGAPSGPSGGAQPTATPAATSTATAVVTPPATVNISVTASTFPGAVTVLASGSVVWNNSSGLTHSVYMDDGAGVCATNTQLPNGAALTLTFPGAGTYHYHCQYHSGCGTSTCNGTCTGMEGLVYAK